MQILLITHYYAPENGAPQRRWSALIQRFTAAGHSVDVICPPPHYPSGRVPRLVTSQLRAGGVMTDESGARVFRVSYLPHDGRIHTRSIDHLWAAAASVIKARRLMRNGEISPDVVVATAPALPSLIAGRLIASGAGLPLVVEMRDAWPDLVSHTPGLAVGRGPAAMVKRQVHRAVTALQRDAAHVVTTTESFASVLAQRGIRDATVIRNGTNLDRYRAVPPRRRDHHQLRALYMGTIGRSQGLEVVVQAAAKLRDDGVPLEVRIVGHGAAAGRLRDLNRSLGEPTQIIGAVPGKAVLSHYMWADTCIVSLRDWAPFAWTVPSKLYELMAAGRHMTAIIAGESAELISDAASGDVVAPGDVDSLARLWRELQSDRSRLDVGPAGREWVALHAEYDALAEQYLSVLDGAISRT